MTKNQLNIAKLEAKTKLLEMFKPGDTVYTCLRSVSASGMTRTFDVFKISDGEVLNVSWLIHYANKGTGGNGKPITMKGCGMDMAFALVYELSQSLFGNGNGYALKQRTI